MWLLLIAYQGIILDLAKRNWVSSLVLKVADGLAVGSGCFDLSMANRTLNHVIWITWNGILSSKLYSFDCPSLDFTALKSFFMRSTRFHCTESF
jgi:hypothetical protein